MIRKIGFLAPLLAACLLSPDAFARGGHGGGGHSSHGGSHPGGGHSTGTNHSHSTSRSSTSKNKSEHVGSFRRKDGKTVKSYDRHPAYTKPAKSGSHKSSHAGTVSKHSRTSTVHHSTTAQRDKNGRIHRSAHAKDEFKRGHPCPSTGRSSGACPGYVIDHVKSLKRGGPDSASNMQWQTVADAKAKDKWE